MDNQQEMEMFYKSVYRLFLAWVENGVVSVKALLKEDAEPYWGRAKGYMVCDVRFCSIGVLYNHTVCDDDLLEIAENLAILCVINGKQNGRGTHVLPLFGRP